jgi:hypothetical protein
MNIDFNQWWDEDDLTTQGNPFTDGTPAFWAWEGWCAGVKAEREACATVCDDLPAPDYVPPDDVMFGMLQLLIVVMPSEQGATHEH